MNRVTFQENVGPGIGTLVINGLVLPHDTYDPLGKIWASVKKRLRERYRVDVAGLFTYNDEKKVISCSFCLNYGISEIRGLDSKVYTARFESTFDCQMVDFEEVIEAFIESPNGLSAYKKALKTNPGKRDIDKVINSFLFSVGMRTEKEERQSLKKRGEASKD